MSTKYDIGSKGKSDQLDTQFYTAMAWLTALSVSIASLATA